MVDTKSKIFVSWGEVNFLTDMLIKSISFEVTSVMGLPRGGLIPAVILSHKLNVPLVFEPTENTLVIDDICDSGETFIKIYQQHPNLKFACLHYKMHTSNFMPTVWADLYEGDDWIVYPWEQSDSETIQDYLK